MHIGIVGSRDWDDPLVVHELTAILSNGATIHTGCCRDGVDFFVKDILDETETPFVTHRADWEKYGKAAGPIRNKELVEACDIVFVFCRNNSRGSSNVIDLCRKAGKPCFVYRIDDTCLDPLPFNTGWTCVYCGRINHDVGKCECNGRERGLPPVFD